MRAEMREIVRENIHNCLRVDWPTGGILREEGREGRRKTMTLKAQ